MAIQPASGQVGKGRRRSAIVAKVVGIAGLLIVAWSLIGLEGVAHESSDKDLVRRVRSIVDYRKSGNHPYWDTRATGHGHRRWTPPEIIALLTEFPGDYIDMGIWTGAPTGSMSQREVGRIVDEVQALGKAEGVDTSHLMVHFRNDVYAKRATKTPDCTICEGSGRCLDLCTWEGAMADAHFDPAWIMTVPRSEHHWAMDQIWGGDESKDPWSPLGLGCWPEWIDRHALAIANTAERVVALYGPVQDADTSAFGRNYRLSVSGALMDLRNPAYREWSAKKLVADLRFMGIDPGESAAIQYHYKPGWHTYYAGPPSGDRCFVPNSHMWTGPANPCYGIHPPGGPFTRTSYRAGEYEAAINASLRTLEAALVSSGLGSVKIITVERPRFGRTPWAILDPSIKAAPWIIGDLEASCDRTRLTLPLNPITCRRSKATPKSTVSPEVQH
jgi:hypothetical protein